MKVLEHIHQRYVHTRPVEVLADTVAELVPPSAAVLDIGCCDGLLSKRILDKRRDILDYRRCVVRNLTIPILFWSRGMKPEAWSNRLQCALAAYADIKCEELLDA